MKMRFGRGNRLGKPCEFRAVFRKGKRGVSREFVMLRLRGGDAKCPARLGLAVGRKQIRRAVDRNRIKRIARESFRRAAGGLRGVDAVLIPQRSCLALDNGRLRALLDHLWKKP